MEKLLENYNVPEGNRFPIGLLGLLFVPMTVAGITGNSRRPTHGSS